MGIYRTEMTKMGTSLVEEEVQPFSERRRKSKGSSTLWICAWSLCKTCGSESCRSSKEWKRRYSSTDGKKWGHQKGRILRTACGSKIEHDYGANLNHEDLVSLQIHVINSWHDSLLSLAILRGLSKCGRDSGWGQQNCGPQWDVVW